MVFRNKKAAGKAGHNLVYQDNKPAFIKKLLSSVPETPTIHSKAMQNQHGFELLDKKARRELREAHKTDSEHRKSTEYNKTEQEGSDDRNSEIMEQAEVAKIIHKPPVFRASKRSLDIGSKAEENVSDPKPGRGKDSEESVARGGSELRKPKNRKTNAGSVKSVKRNKNLLSFEDE